LLEPAVVDDDDVRVRKAARRPHLLLEPARVPALKSGDVLAILFTATVRSRKESYAL